MGDKLDHFYMIGRSVKWYDHSAQNLAFLKKNKHTTTIEPSNYTHEHLSQRNENLHTHTQTFVAP